MINVSLIYNSTPLLWILNWTICYFKRKNILHVFWYLSTDNFDIY